MKDNKELINIYSSVEISHKKRGGALFVLVGKIILLGKGISRSNHTTRMFQ